MLGILSKLLKLLNYVGDDGGTINFTYNQNVGWSISIACFSTYNLKNQGLLLVDTKDYREFESAVDASVYQLKNNGGKLH